MSESLIDLQLSEGHSKNWQQLSKGAFRGHAFKEGSLISVQAWEQLLTQAYTAEKLSVQLRTLNGHFTCIWEGKDYAFAAVDIGRSLPLFWKVEEGRIILRDQLGPEQLEPTRWYASRALAQAEFIPGHHTLSFGWQQLQAGELLEFRDGLVYLHTYFEHRRPTPFNANIDTLTTQFTTIIEQFTQRWLTYANGRPIVIPLSGGYDSRLLLAALYQVGYPQIKTFTYGQPDSKEAKIAKAITDQLQVEWQFVHYTPALIQRFFHPEFKAYAHYAGNLCATPQEQDFFAIWSLKEKGLIPPDSIICPGYCGDFQAGSYTLPNRIRKLNRQQKERLQNYLFERFNHLSKPELRQFWQIHLPQANIQHADEALSEMEHWILREYVPKYVVNGVRAFEYWGYDWYLPLWDEAFISFWQRVPQIHRQGMTLYRDTLARQLFEPLHISYPEDFQQETLSTIGHWLPLNWKKRMRKLLPATNTDDVNGLHWLRPAIQQALDISPIDETLPINGLVGRWYQESLITEYLT